MALQEFPHIILGISLLVFTACNGEKKENESISTVLIVAESPNLQERIVSKNPSPELIESTVESLSWEYITFVVIKKSEKEWIELSGSLDPADGLSMRYSDSSGEYVSDGLPDSLRSGTKTLKQYLLGRSEWKRILNWN